MKKEGKVVITDRHAFYVGPEKKKLPLFGPKWKASKFKKAKGKAIALSVRQIEALYYVLESETSEISALQEFEQAVNGLIMQGLVKYTTKGLKLTKVGEEIVGSLKYQGLMPPVGWAPES